MGIDAVGFTEDNPTSFNRYAYANNNPYRYVDPDGNVIESPWDLLNIGIGVASFTANLGAGNVGGAALDAVGVVVDTAALFLPGVPGGAGTAIKAKRLADAVGGVTKGGDETVDVFRVFGGDARAQGFSFTTVDPRTVKNFRDGAGLPSGGASGATNSADFLIRGTANTKDIIKSRSALPLDGNKGGLPELIIDPKNVKITDFSVIKP